ncbi:hypothetical protein IEQ34_022787 [Dendrobium chrysotoxum]|uniref:Uncharacterized protein n=1 Tax=Dendrobium chrysotoxum TaxID=161865 RepID=A0AAV7G000_DENCH|nr:hypothetical protein IEQ34_022787 [Dendrobium chrysotoxum]
MLEDDLWVFGVERQQPNWLYGLPEPTNEEVPNKVDKMVMISLDRDLNNRTDRMIEAKLEADLKAGLRVMLKEVNLEPQLGLDQIILTLDVQMEGNSPLRDVSSSLGSKLDPSVAHILVALDITKQFSDHVWLGSEKLGYIQQVEMEEFPLYYSHCKVLGHSNAGYLILHPHLPTNPAPPNVSVEPLVVSEGNFTVPEVNLYVTIPLACEAILPVRPVALSPTVVVPMNSNDVFNLVCLGGTNALSDGALLLNHSPSACESSLFSSCLRSGPFGSYPGVTPIQLVGQLVEVPVNLFSPDALVSHVGVSSGGSVRMQIDWLKCSSLSSSEVEEVECFDQQDTVCDENVWVDSFGDGIQKLEANEMDWNELPYSSDPRGHGWLGMTKQPIGWPLVVVAGHWLGQDELERMLEVRLVGWLLIFKLS